MNMIDELSREHTTQETIQYYRNKHGSEYMNPLTYDMESCGIGNKLAILAVIGREVECYLRQYPEKEVLEDADIVESLIDS